MNLQWYFVSENWLDFGNKMIICFVSFLSLSHGLINWMTVKRNNLPKLMALYINIKQGTVMYVGSNTKKNRFERSKQLEPQMGNSWENWIKKKGLSRSTASFWRSPLYLIENWDVLIVSLKLKQGYWFSVFKNFKIEAKNDQNLLNWHKFEQKNDLWANDL